MTAEAVFVIVGTFVLNVDIVNVDFLLALVAVETCRYYYIIEHFYYYYVIVISLKLRFSYYILLFS